MSYPHSERQNIQCFTINYSYACQLKQFPSMLGCQVCLFVSINWGQILSFFLIEKITGLFSFITYTVYVVNFINCSSKVKSFTTWKRLSHYIGYVVCVCVHTPYIPQNSLSFLTLHPPELLRSQAHPPQLGWWWWHPHFYWAFYIYIHRYGKNI